MGEHAIVRGMLLRLCREVPGTSSLAKAVLGWAQPHAGWLVGKRGVKPKLGWRELRAGLAIDAVRDEPKARPLAMAAALAEALKLDTADTAVLVAAAALDRCPRARALVKLLLGHHADVAALVADLAGIDVHALRRSQPVRLGLVELHTRRDGGVEIDTSWTFDRLLDRGAADGEALLEVVVGPRQASRLDLADFIGQRDDAEFLARLLAGAVRNRAAGVNILLHGPPGTGKTELARTLGAAAGAALYSVGEADEDGEEPSRWARISALKLAHRMLAERGGACLLFDEMEDMIGDARPEGDWMRGRQGSKLWINRMLETNPVPVIWTTNAIGNIDPAMLRRMSYVLRFDLPSPAAGQAMAARIGEDEGIAVPGSVQALVEAAPETATVLRVAARAGQLAGDAAEIDRAARSLVGALRQGAPLPTLDGPVDLALYEADCDIAALFDRIGAEGALLDVSLLLTGPPGTGKTGLAHQLARTLGRPLIVKRASDLLSMWVGETEKQIADAFREAERRGGVLLFDEADSLLYDRSTASKSWEVTQVNELLTWLERHPLPFVAATNHAGRLDPAALRRFVFKLDLRALGAARAARAFERFFGMPAPADLAEIANLTPGDFAVVRRQLRFRLEASAAAIVALLRAEAEAKPGQGARLGF